MRLQIDSTALVRYTNKLEKVHRSALPVAVRSALNSAAFDVKKNTMPASAKKAFVQRKPTFFKANSKVEPAKGFNIKSMRAAVGFLPNSDASKELEQQEHGGKIGRRQFIPAIGARSGANWNKKVREDLRLANLKNLNIIDADKVRFKNHGKRKAQKFIRASIVAKKKYGSKAFVLGNKRTDGGRTLSQIKTIKVGNGKVKIKRTPVYTYKKGRKVTVAKTQFMRRASMESGMKIEEHFIKAAEKQLMKHISK